MEKTFGSSTDFFQYFALMEVLYNLEKINIPTSPKLNSLFELAKSFNLPDIKPGKLSIYEEKSYLEFRKSDREKVLTGNSEVLVLENLALFQIPVMVILEFLFLALYCFVKDPKKCSFELCFHL